jgi:chromate transporter
MTDLPGAREAAPGADPPGPGGRQVPFAEAFRFWLKLGFISFGGPAGQIAIMHRELVERRRWISEERFLHALNYCMLLPGPEAQQLATYVGWLLHRVRGGLVAGGLFVLPSVFVLLGLSYAYAAHGETPLVAGVLYGFRPVVVAIVGEAVLRIGRRAIRRRSHLAISAAAFAAIYFGGVPFPAIVAAAALLGWLGGRFAPNEPTLARPTGPAGGPERGAPPGGERSPRDEEGASQAIDDDSPPAPHTLPSPRRLLATLAVGVVLWSGALLLLGFWRGFGALHVREYLFFTKAAFVTFGGAYAVLAYVNQAVAETFGWLSQAQTVDGLALAETTPGPLIMALQFVGFMAAWNRPEGLAPWASAVVGALATTFATFLPCFLFIFLGAPYIEVLRRHRGLDAALSGVTAAVVGVILNLALVFGAAVLVPDGGGAGVGAVDWLAAGIAAAAFLALWRLKVEVQWVVLAGGLLGLVKGLVAAGSGGSP